MASSRRTRTVALFAGLVGLCTAACSVVMKWEQDGLPCDKTVVTNANGTFTDFCRAGYSCQVKKNQCLADRSLKTGQACTQARQCAAGAVCPLDLVEGGGVAGTDGVSSCLPGCKDNGRDGGFLQSEGCQDQGEVCLPFLDRPANSAGKALVGGCYPSAGCTGGQGCALNGKNAGRCIVMSASNVTACMQGCEITWSTAQAFSENCDASHTCVPVGVAGSQQFACLYNATNTTATPLGAIAGQTPRTAGQPCSPVLAPCGKGYVCSQGICAQYCQITLNAQFPCPTGQSCCPFTGFATSQPTGFCSASCK